MHAIDRHPVFIRVQTEISVKDYYQLRAVDESLGRQTQPPTPIFQRAELISRPAEAPKPQKKGMLAKWMPKLPKGLPFMSKPEQPKYKYEQFMLQTRYLTFSEDQVLFMRYFKDESIRDYGHFVD